MSSISAKLGAFSIICAVSLTGCTGTPDLPGGTGPAPDGTGRAPAGTPEPRIGGPTTPVVGGDPIPSALEQALTAAAAQDGASLRAAHPVELGESLGYDPSTASGLELIQASPLALTPTQLGKLKANGFVIATSRRFPTFVYGYKSIYAADLPVYVSADSVLYAVHHSFDKVLEFVESAYLVPELDALLDGVQTTLAASSIDASTKADVDLYVAVAKSLLKAELVSPAAGADAQTVASLFGKAQAASGHETTSLFGVERDGDFSQFAPRGHYTHTPALSQYFRAMMWLSRVDLRVVETLGDGTQVFRRPQFDAAVALYEALGTSGRERWAHIDEIIGSFVGERDAATVSDMAGLLATLGTPTFEASKGLSDQQIITAIAAGWGTQRIASRIIVNHGITGSLPLDRSFALFGQRYTVDSHVFVNTTYDRVAGRLMPNPLDIAFAALGNDSALPLLSGDLGNASYAGGLAKTRVLVDAHEASYWEGSLYTQWLGALRTLSPKGGDRNTLPSVALMPAFRERILNTQLASWAELRRDTILYAKQSYTTAPACEFPDAYVDPYPEFYAQLARLAQRLREIADRFPPALATAKPRIDDWARNFVTASGYLEQMARNQRSGMPHSAELMAFINQAVTWQENPNCVGPPIISNVTGWYTRLFFTPDAAVDFDPTIADVHTQPTDEGGSDVGRILHLGTGYARAMIVTVNTCTGPRAYAGLASSYAEKITERWHRLNDQDWANIIQSSPFPDVPWMQRALSE